MRWVAIFAEQMLLMVLVRFGDCWHAAVVAAVVRAAFAAVVSLLRDFCVTIFTMFPLFPIPLSMDLTINSLTTTCGDRSNRRTLRGSGW